MSALLNGKWVSTEHTVYTTVWICFIRSSTTHQHTSTTSEQPGACRTTPQQTTGDVEHNLKVCLLNYKNEDTRHHVGQLSTQHSGLVRCPYQGLKVCISVKTRVRTWSPPCDSRHQSPLLVLGNESLTLRAASYAHRPHSKKSPEPKRPSFVAGQEFVTFGCCTQEFATLIFVSPCRHSGSTS